MPAQDGEYDKPRYGADKTLRLCVYYSIFLVQNHKNC